MAATTAAESAADAQSECNRAAALAAARAICPIETLHARTAASRSQAPETPETQSWPHRRPQRLRQGRPAWLYPSDERLPWHFSWLPDGLVAGSSAPTDRDNYAALLAARTRLVVNLTEAPFEPPVGEPIPCARCACPSAACCASDLFDDIRPHHSMHSMFIPVEDGEVPSYHQITTFLRHALDFTSRGERIVVHCQAGVGRTGVFLAAYLIESLSCSAAEAIKYLRHYRPQSMQFCEDDWFTDPFRIVHEANFRRNLLQERFLERYYREVVLPSRTIPPSISDVVAINPPKFVSDASTASARSDSASDVVSDHSTDSLTFASDQKPSQLQNESQKLSSVDGTDDCSENASTADGIDDIKLDVDTSPRKDSSETLVAIEALSLDTDQEPLSSGSDMPSAASESLCSPQSIDLGSHPLVNMDLLDAEIDMIISRIELRAIAAENEAADGEYDVDELCHLCRGTVAIGPRRISAFIDSPSPYASATVQGIYTPSPLLTALSSPAFATKTPTLAATTSVCEAVISPVSLSAPAIPSSPRCSPEATQFSELVPKMTQISI